MDRTSGACPSCLTPLWIAPGGVLQVGEVTSRTSGVTPETAAKSRRETAVSLPQSNQERRTSGVTSAQFESSQERREREWALAQRREMRAHIAGSVLMGFAAHGAHPDAPDLWAERAVKWADALLEQLKSQEP